MQNTTRHNIITIVCLAIGIKLLYFVLAFILSNCGFIFEDSSNFVVGHINEQGSCSHIFYRNDTGWYEKIATNGHQKITPQQLAPIDNAHWTQSYYAFFPLYPATIKGLQIITGLNFQSAAFAFSFLISIAAFIIFYWFTRLFTQSDKKALAATVILMLFPFTYYFSMELTEAYYLTLLLGAFIGVYNKNLLLLFICSALIVLVRPNGIVMALPLGLYYIERHVFEGQWRMPVKSDFINLLPAMVLIIMPIVLLSYCYYLQQMTGDFFAFATAQKGWARVYANPIKVLLKPKGWRWAIEAGMVFLAIGISIIGRKKIPLSMHVLIWVSLILPLWSGKTLSMPRFISVVFPLFIIMGSFLSTKNKLKPLVYAALLALHLFSYYFWLLPDDLSF